MLAGLMTTGFVSALSAAEQASAEVPVGKDLAAVIALQGLPCGKVVSASQQGEDDFVASCEDGNRYRVYVNADGRVIVKKLD
jgi:hypothetical protein